MGLKKNFEKLNNKNLTVEWFKKASEEDFKKYDLKSGSIEKFLFYFRSHNDNPDEKGLNEQELEELLKKIGFEGKKLKNNFEKLNNKNLTMEWFKKASEEDFKKYDLKNGSIEKILFYFRSHNDYPDEKGLNEQELEELLKKIGFEGKKLKNNFEKLNNKNLT